MQNFLIFISLLLTLPTSAQINLNNPETRQKIKTERGYDVLSRVDTVCKEPLLIYGIYGKDGFVGIIDHTGKEVTPAKYHMIEGMNMDYTYNMFMLYDHFSVRTNDQYGVIKNTGELVFPMDSGYISVEKYRTDNVAQVKRVEMVQRIHRYRKEELNIDGSPGKVKTYTDDDYKTLTLVAEDEFGEFESDGIEVETLKDGSDWDGPKDVSPKPVKKRKKTTQYHPILGKKKSYFSADYYIYEDTASGKLGVAHSETLEVMLPSAYTQFRRLFNEQDQYVFSKDGKQGVIDFHFNVRMEADWDEIRTFDDHYAVRDGKYFAVFDTSFNRLTKFKYQFNQPYNYAMGMVTEVLDKDSNTVLLNFRGKEVLKFDHKRYEVPRCTKLGTPVIIVELKEGFKLLNIDGKPLLDEVFESITAECNVSGEEGHIHPAWNMWQNSPNLGFYVKKDWKYGFINADMKLTIEPKYRSMGESYYDELLYVRDSAGWWVINYNTGEKLISTSSRICPKGTAGLIRTLTDEGYIYWKQNGEQLTPPIPNGDYINRVYHGLYRIWSRENGAIYIDGDGSIMQTSDTHF
jgi:hypothetical protein